MPRPPSRLAWMLARAVAVLVVLPAAMAQADALTLDAAPEIGPAALAGDRVVWIRPEPGGERLLQRHGSTTKTLAFLRSGDQAAGPLRTELLRASESVVVLSRAAGRIEDPSGGFRKTIEVVTRDGRRRRLSDCPGARCACPEQDPLDFLGQIDVDGPRLAFGGLECERRGVRVHGTRPRIRTLQRLPEARSPGLQLAGRFVAWGDESLVPGRRRSVRVYDRRAGRLAYRWRVPIGIDRDLISLDWDLDATGRLAAGFSYESPTGFRSGFGVVDPRTRRLRRLGGGVPGLEWIGAGRLVARTQRRVVVHDLGRRRTRRAFLAQRPDRQLVGADDRCLLFRGDGDGPLALEPLPGGLRSALCAR